MIFLYIKVNKLLESRVLGWDLGCQLHLNVYMFNDLAAWLEAFKCLNVKISFSFYCLSCLPEQPFIVKQNLSLN